MYITEFNAIISFSKGGPHSVFTSPKTISIITSARFILLNSEGDVTSPLSIIVWKSRVPFIQTEFYEYLRELFPSLSCSSSSYHNRDVISITDDSDVVRFLLMYGGDSDY